MELRGILGWGKINFPLIFSAPKPCKLIVIFFLVVIGYNIEETFYKYEVIMKKWKKVAAAFTALLIGSTSVLPAFAQTGALPKAERIKYSYQSSHINIADAPKQSQYDVVVFGSDPEAVAAAYSAGRQGLSVLMVDFKRDRVGGLYTLGWLNMLDFNYAPGQEEWYANVYKDNFLNHGVFERFYNLIGSKKAFDIVDAQTAMEKLLAEGKVEVMLTSDSGFEYRYLPEQKISSIVLNTNSQPVPITAKVVIDASKNADIAIAAGAKFHEGKEDIGLKGMYQSATLVFKIKGVNWDQVRVALQQDNNPNTGLSGDAAWGYKEMFQCQVNNPKMQIRDLNLGRQKDGTVLVNAFQIFDFKPYDMNYQIATRDEAIKRIKTDVIPFMRANLQGFANAEFVAAAPEFYIRENRHMIGEQTLTANDVFDSVFPANYIASGSYPIDIQAIRKGDLGSFLSGTKPYGLGPGVMMPKGIDGIYVPSKAASFDSIAYGSARTVPVLMALGEAAGVMAKVSIQNDVSTRDILTNPRNLLSTRTLLYDKGVRLVSYPNAHSIDKSYAAAEIRYLRSKAMITMTYQNEYDLQGKATVGRMFTMMYLIENNSPYDVHRNDVMNLIGKPLTYQLTLNDMIPVMSHFVHKEYTTMDEFIAAGIIPQNIYETIIKKATLQPSVQKVGQKAGEKQQINVDLTTEDFYALMGNVIKHTPVVQKTNEFFSNN